MALQEFYNSGDDSYHGGNATYVAGQTFTTVDAFTIASIKALLYKSSSPGTCYVSIYATSGGVPSGGALTTGTFNGNDLTTSTAGEWKEVAVTPYELSADTMYAITIKASANSLAWRYDGSSPTYEGGTQVRSSDGGSSWSAINGSDAMFETYNVEASYVDMSGTVSGTGGLSGDLISGTLTGLTATISGNASISATLLAHVNISLPSIYKRVCAAGNNQFYYEDI